MSAAGAIELPPESEFCEPISVSSSPSAQDGAVGVPQRSELVVDEVVGAAGRVRRIRRHIAGQAQRGVALGRQEIVLASIAAEQDLGIVEVGSTGEVEADERHLAGTRGDVAHVRGVGFERRAHGGVGAATQQQAEQRTGGHHRGSREEALGDEIATRARRPVTLVFDRLVEAESARALLE
jgi:hypothetical protein